MPTVTLTNKTKQPIVFNLPHHIVPECATMGVVATFDRDKLTGAKVLRPVRKPLSGSVTLLAKGVVEGLPVSVQRAPDVIAAVNAGKVILTVKE